MAHPAILVAGATGKTGAAVVAQLREKGWPVRAIVRTRDARSERLGRLGAEVVVADLFDPDGLLDAMRGTARAYYCPPWHPYMIQSAAAFAVAAREAKLEAVVGLTQWLASPSHPSLMTRQSWLADHLFSMVPGAAHVAVNPGYFADSYLNQDLIAFPAQLGLFPWPYGRSRNAPPSNEDVARVAVAALVAPERHAGRAYRPTGPELLSGRDMATVLGGVLGRSVAPMPMPAWMFLRAMRVSGRPRFEQMGVRAYIEEHRRGAFEFGAPTDHVREATGQAPENFETIARRYAAAPAAQRSLNNQLRALAAFLEIGTVPGHDLDLYERRQGHPAPPRACFAAGDPHWRAERDRRSAQGPVERFTAAGASA